MRIAKKESKRENALFEVSLKIILKNKKGEILLLKTPKKSSLQGYYDLLGGRIREKEIGRPFRKIMTREIQEEIGTKVRYKVNEIPVAVGRHYYFSKSQQKIQYIFWVFFEAFYQGGDIQISSEHSQYEWKKVNKQNLKKYFIKGSLEGMQHYLTKKFAKK